MIKKFFFFEFQNILSAGHLKIKVGSSRLIDLTKKIAKNFKQKSIWWQKTQIVKFAAVNR